MATEEAISVLDDGDLVRRSQSGDHTAFEALVARYRRRVYGVCLNRVHDPDEAADLAQESFVRAWQELRQVRQPERFAGWLRRVADNLCSAWLRHRRPLVVDPDDLAASASDAETLESAVQRRLDARRVWEALAVLSEAQRLTITLFYVDGYSYQEIARFLETPLETIRGRLRDARRRLRKELWDMAEQTVSAGQPGPEFTRAVARRVEVSEWYRSFGEMIAAGISIVRTLYILENDPYSPPIREATTRIREVIQNGGTLSQALMEEPVLKSTMAVGMVRAGEVGGILDRTLVLFDQWQHVDEAARRMELALWCQTLGILLQSGVPILQSFRTVADVAGEELRAASQRLHDTVREGKSLGGVMRSLPDLFPQEVTAILVASEEAGELDVALLDAAALLAEQMVRALGTTGSRPASRRYVAGLHGSLRHASPERRVEAAAALGRVGDASSVPALADALGDKEPAVREAAARALSAIGGPGALAAVARACSDADAGVRLAGAEGLARADQAAGAMPEAGGARSVLDRLSRDPDAGVRRTAVRHLAGVAEPGLIPVLAAALEDDDYRITAMAAEGLAHIGVPAADALLAASASDKENVRSYAAGAMAQTDTPAVRARLRALLDDGGARGQAARSLGALKDRDAVPALIRILEEDTDVPQAQHLAAGALGSIGDARAVPALLGLLDGRDWPADYASWAADWAAGALIKIGDTSAIPGARGVFRDEERASRVRQAALRVLVALDDRAIAGEVAHLAVGGGWEWAASDALKRIGDAPAIRQLVAALGSEDSEQRRRAVLVLSRLTDDDGLAEARAWVAEAGAVPALRRLAEDPNVATSGPAQGVLARVER